MKKDNFQFEYHLVSNREQLSQEDRELLDQALVAASHAYAPYSNFLVGAAARLTNQKVLTGSNQENASYPVGICAERVLLGNISSLFPNSPIDTMAITYRTQNRKSDTPVSPCGMCRQALVEYENRVGKPIRLLLAGELGEVLIIESSKMLLPFAFESSHLNK